MFFKNIGTHLFRARKNKMSFFKVCWILYTSLRFIRPLLLFNTFRKTSVALGMALCSWNLSFTRKAIFTVRITFFKIHFVNVCTGVQANTLFNEQSSSQSISSHCNGSLMECLTSIAGCLYEKHCRLLAHNASSTVHALKQCFASVARCHCDKQRYYFLGRKVRPALCSECLLWKSVLIFVPLASQICFGAFGWLAGERKQP